MAATSNQANVTHWRVLTLFFLLCLPQVPLLADDMWTGLFEEHLQAAVSGETGGQYEVGIMYLKGQGVEQDRVQAAHWLKAASASGHQEAASRLRRMNEQQEKFNKLKIKASSGDADAQYDIATMYLQGQGTERDTAEARQWLSRLAGRKHEKAITRLGILSYKGEGGPVDYAAAFALFEQVKNDSVLAQYYLGEMYANGRGVTKNYHTAISLYEKAAQGGFHRARGKIINMEEELAMKERRRVRLAEASPPESRQPAAKTKIVQQTKKTVKPAEPKQAVTPSVLDALAAAHWLRGSKPVDYLPSKVTRCEQSDKGGLVCFSQVLHRSTGNQNIEYRVKSLIESNRDAIVIRYRNLVLDVVDLSAGADEDELPGGYDAEVEGADQSAQGFRVKTGWTREHRVECKLEADEAVVCTKDKMHTITLVGRKPVVPKNNLAQGSAKDY